jgi:hypothetical protein
MHLFNQIMRNISVQAIKAKPNFGVADFGHYANQFYFKTTCFVSFTFKHIAYNELFILRLLFVSPKCFQWQLLSIRTKSHYLHWQQQ